MTETSPALFSSWTPRVSLFAGALIVSAILMHRLLGMSTPLAVNLFVVSFGLAAIAVVLGVIALWDVWRRGADGAAWAVIGIVVGISVFGWPLAMVPAYLNLPRINDATTDLASPPQFSQLAKEREKAGLANPVRYPLAEFADLQKAAYPDLRPLFVNRSLDDTYELALDALKRLRFQIVAETPPNPRQAGIIEAVDRTMVIGFYDDVVLRVESEGGRARIDVRSASRYGAHDLGRNSSRVRRVLSELQARIDASVSTPGQRFARIKSRLDKGKSVKRGKGGDQRTSAHRRSQDSARSGAQRGPVPKATQPARASGRASDRQD
jgi:uncharacterized protein (DUF1499 family)